MATIPVECSCGKRLKAKEEAAGTSAMCPACGKLVDIPVWAKPKLPEVDLGIDLSHPPEPNGGRSNARWKDPARLIALGYLLRGSEPTFRSRVDAADAISDPSEREAQLEALTKEAFDRCHEAFRRSSVDLSDGPIRDMERWRMEAIYIQDRISAPYLPLILEASQCFTGDVSEIGMSARDAAKHLLEKDIRADPVEILKGGIYLVKRSKAPGTERQGFRAYTTQYGYWREEGLTHQQAIDKMWELEKF